ncbi:MAG: DUF4012 domain-containing protein, partial [Eggerthellaceae bacterium]|nr:DUF4012 domain-containing protein [Eggerthellaceae bacterium]
MAGSKYSGKTAYGTKPYSTVSLPPSLTSTSGASGTARTSTAGTSYTARTSSSGTSGVYDAPSASGAPLSAPSPAREAARARTQGRRTRRKVVRSVVAIVVVAVLALGAFAFSQVRAARSVMDVLVEDAAFLATDLIALQDRLTEEDYLAASDAVRDLSSRTTHMKGVISSDEMGAAKSLPFIGRDLKAVSQLVSTLENLWSSALTPMLEAARAYPTTNLFDGTRGADLTALVALLGVADSAVPALREAAASLDSLPEFRMAKLGEAFDPVRVLAADAKDQLQTYGDSLERFAGIAKGLIGEEGNRTYLIVYQNTAELRATGGVPAIVGTLTMENGVPTLGDFGLFGSMMADQTPEAAGIGEVELAISRDGAAQTRGANYLPDFSQAASIWAAAFEEKTGTPIDGVIALSPHMLQRLLNFAGGITLSDGTKMD